jgi:branched-chain amino acid transport system permease protein
MKWVKAAALAVPMLLPLFVDNQYYVHGIVCRIFIYTILVASLDLVVGFIGDISIGHAGIFAIGSYSVAILTAPPSMNASGTMTFMPELPFMAGLVAGVALAAFAGLLLGFPALRASGPYLAVTTIAYGLIIYTFINEQEFLTNGTKGISVAALHIGGSSLDGNRFLWVVYPAMLAVMAFNRNLSASFWGRAFEAIKFSSIAAESCGISRSYFKIAAFVISAAIAGFAGGLFTELDRYVAPNTFSLDFSVLALIALILGGLRSTLGNVIGMTLVVVLPDAFTWFADFRLVVFGILLLLALFFLPGGVAGLVGDLIGRFVANDADAAEMRAALEADAAADASPLFAPFARDPGSRLALQLDGARMRFGGLVAVNDLDLRVPAGVIHGLMGPNGSGKSTTVNVISGLYVPESGRVRIFGDDVTRSRPFERARRGVARTFQNLQLFSGLSVLDNVMVGQHLSFRSPLWQVVLGVPAVHREERALRVKAYRLLQFVGLERYAFEKASSLAYGQARRLEIARALAVAPRLLLLDEPAAGLTAGEIAEFNAMIRRVRDQGIAVLVIEHHMDMLMAVSEEITVLDFGRKIAEGAPASIQADRTVISAYLGTEARTPPVAGTPAEGP